MLHDPAVERPHIRLVRVASTTRRLGKEDAMDPVVELLDLPKGYGKATTPLPWTEVRSRLDEALNYWLVTLRPDGRPHAVPTDGIWADDAWYFGGGPDTVHMRNVQGNPDAVLHLGDGTWAVIVEGTVEHVVPDEPRAKRIAEAGRKYEPMGYAPKPEDYLKAGAWVLEPSRVLAWTRYPTDATRFRFTRPR
jgi:nitroimidazol reductase NimA-like FMN-containing flavoprotein (pyridoxamine 5'-phosphate oxidase superfamily)